MLCRPVGAGMVRAVLFISNAGGERILQSGLAFFGIVFAYMGNFLYLCNRFEVKDEMVRGRRGNGIKKCDPFDSHRIKVLCKSLLHRSRQEGSVAEDVENIFGCRNE